MSVGTLTSLQDGLNAHSPSHLRSTTPVTLNVLPGEILQEIAAFLLYRRLPCDNPPQPIFSVVSDLGIRKSQQGKDLMAMSSCSKRMRKVLFAHNMLRNLNIHACDGDVAIISNMSAEDRSCVKLLHIKTLYDSNVNPGLPIDFRNMIHPFPNLQEISIDWTPLPAWDPRFATMEAGWEGLIVGETATGIPTLSPSSVTRLIVKTCDRVHLADPIASRSPK